MEAIVIRKKPAKIKTFVDIIKGLRNDWGGVNPVTKIIPNKKKFTRKDRHMEVMQNED